MSVPQRNQTDSATRSWGPYVLLALVTAAPFAQVAGFQFIYLDDDGYVFTNPWVMRGLTFEGARWAFTTFFLSNWHPLTWLSHMADWEIYGSWAGGHHLTNLALHLASTLVLYRVLVELTGARGRSLLVALLFGVHPLHVEPVAWVSSRKDVLSTLFGFSALWAYARYALTPSVGRNLLVAGCMALSLLAKPVFVTLPFVLLLLDFWPLRRLEKGAGRMRLVLEKLPLFALSAASSAVAFLSQDASGSVMSLTQAPLDFRILNAGYAYVTLLVKTLLPTGLCLYYPIEQTGYNLWRGTLSTGLVLLVSIECVRRARRHPHFAVGWLWFVGTLVPMIGLVQLGELFIADRYSYVPLVGLSIAIVWGVAQLLDGFSLSRGPRVAIAAVVVLALAATSAVQTSTWRDSHRVFSHALALYPDSVLVHLSLGRVHEVARDHEIARSHYERVLALRPEHFHALGGIGNVSWNQGRRYQAEAWYRRAVESKPEDPGARVVLARTLRALGRFEEAEQELLVSLRLSPGDAAAQAELQAVRRRERRR